MKKIVLLGSRGNMGKRYEAVLKYLGHEILPFDIDSSFESFKEAIKESNRVVIATPTNEHRSNIIQIANIGWPCDILCEKPIVKDTSLRGIYDLCERQNINLYSVNQYCYLKEYGDFNGANGPSLYNYYNTGRDGLLWDCFQIWAIARHTPLLSNKSPSWYCALNGHSIAKGQMDWCYIEMMRDFLDEKKRFWSKEKVIETTEKILNAQSADWNSGPNGFDKA